VQSVRWLSMGQVMTHFADILPALLTLFRYVIFFLYLLLELVHKLKHKRIYKMSLLSSLFIKHPRKGFNCTLIVFIFSYVYVRRL
jgi:hypothetical protein